MDDTSLDDTAVDDTAVDDTDLTVTRAVDLDATVDEVWQAVVDDEGRAAWWDGDTALDLTPGGTGHATDPDGTVRRIRVDHVEDGAAEHSGSGPGPSRRLAFRWWPEDGGPASTVELVVEPRPGGSRLTVTESRPGPFRVTMCAGRLLDLELLLLCRALAPAGPTARG